MMTIENLHFRRPQMDDAEVLCRLKNNENAARLLGGVHHAYSVNDIEKWIDFHNSNPDELILVIEDTQSGNIIGHIGLYKIDRVPKKAELGILIADERCWGKGYGTKATRILVDYAFKTLGLHKVTAEVLTPNAPSVAMFKKCGFSVDGCLRDDVYKNGRYYDVFTMSILSDEQHRQ